MILILIELLYGIGIVVTWVLINDSHTPNAPGIPGPPDTESNLSPAWAFIWPVFWLKTIPVFVELRREEKRKSMRIDGRKR